MAKPQTYHATTAIDSADAPVFDNSSSPVSAVQRSDSTDTVLLACEHLAKLYEDETVFAGIDLVLCCGQATALMGASGQGKSTLLSIVGLLLAPSAGRVLVYGSDATQLADADISRLRARTFGFVFQHTQLIGSLRTLDNILLPSCFGGLGNPASIEKRAYELMERFGIANRAFYYPHQLSVGQKRRVAFVRALLLEPAILIADEPTNDLDKATAQEVSCALKAYAKEGHAVLFATHDEELAASAERIMLLEDGRLTQHNASSLQVDGKKKKEASAHA